MIEIKENLESTVGSEGGPVRNNPSITMKIDYISDL